MRHDPLDESLAVRTDLDRLVVILSDDLAVFRVVLYEHMYVDGRVDTLLPVYVTKGTFHGHLRLGECLPHLHPGSHFLLPLLFLTEKSRSSYFAWQDTHLGS